jgi:hypothetical protein
MTGFNHALTGAAIGLALQNPLLVIPVALASHFVLDVIPHFGGHPIYEWGHKHFFKLIALDAVLCVAGVGLTLWLAPQAAIAIFLGVAFAMLPDLTLIHYYTHGKPKNWLHDFHLGIQWFERPSGILVEASYLVFIITAIFSLR